MQVEQGGREHPELRAGQPQQHPPRPVERVVERAPLVRALGDQVALEPHLQVEVGPVDLAECAAADQVGECADAACPGQGREQLGCDVQVVVAGPTGPRAVSIRLIVVVSPEVARSLAQPAVKVLGAGEAPKHAGNGAVDLTYTGAAWSGPAAFDEAGVGPADIDYASIYDSFTISVLLALEDLGFCAKGKGGQFVSDGALLAPHGRLPFNTDGGGLCNNHPSNRGGMPKIIEAVRQLRGQAHPAVQVPDCALALVQGTGGRLGTRSGSATLILGAADA